MQPTRRKRPRSSHSRSPQGRTTSLPMFGGESASKLIDFDQAWLAHMDSIQIDERTAIHQAATFLKDEALQIWKRNQTEGRDCQTWKEFIDILRESVITQTIRIANAFIGLKELKQQEGQSVLDIYQKFVSLRAEIPKPVDEDHQDAWWFTTCLQPEIREQLFKPGAKVTNLEQILSDARSTEESIRRQQLLVRPSQEDVTQVRSSKPLGRVVMGSSRLGSVGVCQRCLRRLITTPRQLVCVIKPDHIRCDHCSKHECRAVSYLALHIFSVLIISRYHLVSMAQQLL